MVIMVLVLFGVFEEVFWCVQEVIEGDWVLGVVNIVLYI